MKIIKYPDRSEWPSIIERPVINSDSLESIVKDILSEVKINGEEALRKYTLQFDKIDLKEIQVSAEEFEEYQISEALKEAIAVAKNNIEKFHLAQKESITEVETSPGVLCWRKSVGIEKIGLYIPGGSAPLFSTVLMLGIPAQIAGCKEVILCTPPNRDGKIDPAILYTAKLVGIKKIFKAGGAQAIAAMAYGTANIPKVYKIFGPGNQYVTAAKQVVSTEGIAIDIPAGPSELAVLADETANASFIASDLLSQAEHGADSQVILVSNNEKLIEDVIREIAGQIQVLPRKKTAEEALKNSKAILVKDLQQGIDLVNEYAPEHLILVCERELELADKIINAGSVFLGSYSPESAGDYASGTNHTLPTNGYSKAYSGVSLDSFVKKITFQKLTAQGLKNIGPAIEIMAETEQLQAHKNAVTIRLKEIEKQQIEK